MDSECNQDFKMELSKKNTSLTIIFFYSGAVIDSRLQ